MKTKITKCNKHKWLVGLALVASITFFSGCGNSMPKCDDKEVLDLVTQLVQKQWLQVPFLCGTAEGNHNLFDSKKSSYNEELHKLGYENRRAYCEARKYDYSAFMINSADKETKKISCKAQVSTKQPHIQTLLPILNEELLRVAIFAGIVGKRNALGDLEEAVNFFVREENFITYEAQYTQDGKVYVEFLGYE